MTDYQKNGITVNGNVNGTVTGNIVTGDGPITYIAQNGIQVGFGATALIRGNTVSGNYYTPTDTVACGLLFFEATGVKQQANSLFANEVDLATSGAAAGRTTRRARGTATAGGRQSASARGLLSSDRYGETRCRWSQTRVTVSIMTWLVPALSEPTSYFAGHAFSRCHLATGSPVALNITIVAFFRAAAQSFIASSCQAHSSMLLVIPRLKVTVGGGRLPGTASLRPSDSMKSMS